LFDIRVIEVEEAAACIRNDIENAGTMDYFAKVMLNA
jgi:hypothetical protein